MAVGVGGGGRYTAPLSAHRPHEALHASLFAGPRARDRFATQLATGPSSPAPYMDAEDVCYQLLLMGALLSSALATFTRRSRSAVLHIRRTVMVHGNRVLATRYLQVERISLSALSWAGVSCLLILCFATAQARPACRFRVCGARVKQRRHRS